MSDCVPERAAEMPFGTRAPVAQLSCPWRSGLLAPCRAVGVHFARSITLPVFPPPHLQFFVASDPTVKNGPAVA